MTELKQSLQRANDSFAYHVVGFSHFSCPKSLCGSTWSILNSRRLKLSLSYVLKLKSLPENPAYSCVFEPENIKLFEESESKIPPLGIRILPHLEKSKLDLNLIDDAPWVDIAPGSFQLLQSVLT